VLGVVGYIGGRALFGERPGGAKPDFGDSTSGPAKQVPASEVESKLTAEGLTCYDTAPKVRSCYRTEPDGAQLTVRTLEGPGGMADYVSVSSAPAGGSGLGFEPRGDGATAYRETAELVAETLLGDPSLLPEAGSANQTARSSWGVVTLDAGDDNGRVTFDRDGGAEPPGVSGFPKPAEDVRAAMAKLGYTCGGVSCSGEGAGSPDASITAESMSINVGSSAGAAATKSFNDLLTSALSGADLEAAKKWAAANVKPKAGFAQADAGGVHLAIAEADGKVQLLLTPAQTD
jgi:hypothetical protein